MKNFALNCVIEAPVDEVFAFFADFDRVSQQLSTVETMRLLTPGPVQVGSRVLQKRRVLGQMMEQEMDCVAVTLNQQLAIRAHLKGTDYLTVFRFAAISDRRTSVELQFSSVPITKLAKLSTPFVCSLVCALKPLFQQDLNELKQAF